jgi:hypothetical protein
MYENNEYKWLLKNEKNCISRYQMPFRSDIMQSTKKLERHNILYLGYKSAQNDSLALLQDTQINDY